MITRKYLCNFINFTSQGQNAVEKKFADVGLPVSV